MLKADSLTGEQYCALWYKVSGQFRLCLFAFSHRCKRFHTEYRLCCCNLKSSFGWYSVKAMPTTWVVRRGTTRFYLWIVGCQSPIICSLPSERRSSPPRNYSFIRAILQSDPLILERRVVHLI